MGVLNVLSAFWQILVIIVSFEQHKYLANEVVVLPLR